MIGWQYRGPFDDLDKQNEPYPSFAEWRGEDVHESREGLPEATLLLNEHDAASRGMRLPTDDETGDDVVQLSDEELKTFAETFPGRFARFLSIQGKGVFRAEVPETLPENEARLFCANLGLDVTRTENWLTAFSESRSNPNRQELLDRITAQRAILMELQDELPKIKFRKAIECHRVIDGGRDSKGSPNVTAGEGTGIVHIAPGCGDIDNQLGQNWGIANIAPLLEDGTFDEGFGDFTGREAIDPNTANLVFEKLKEKHLLVAVEDYPHIYPHCWRTGDELVFRLVDEWFINMDWRQEIMEVTKAITWKPESIDGQNREIEWLTNMRDWMVSKKRFWGLALPIWVDPDDPTDFEVIGSLEELKQRAVEGWDEFEGNTPHRPWIDGVKIKSEKTGKVLSRHSRRGKSLAGCGHRAFFDDDVQHQSRRVGQVVPGRSRHGMFPRPVPQLVLFDARAVYDDALRRPRAQRRHGSSSGRSKRSWAIAWSWMNSAGRCTSRTAPRSGSRKPPSS